MKTVATLKELDGKQKRRTKKMEKRLLKAQKVVNWKIMKLKTYDIFLIISSLTYLCFHLFLENKITNYKSVIDNSAPIEYETIDSFYKSRYSRGRTSYDYFLLVNYKNKNYKVEISPEDYQKHKLHQTEKLPLYYCPQEDSIISKYTFEVLTRVRGLMLIFSLIPACITIRRQIIDYRKIKKTYSTLHSEKYVYVESDGSVRELNDQEKEYLETKFSPRDKKKPFVKYKYKSPNPDNEMNGFLMRKKVPVNIKIKSSTK